MIYLTAGFEDHSSSDLASFATFGSSRPGMSRPGAGGLPPSSLWSTWGSPSRGCSTRHPASRAGCPRTSRTRWAQRCSRALPREGSALPPPQALPPGGPSRSQSRTLPRPPHPRPLPPRPLGWPWQADRLGRRWWGRAGSGSRGGRTRWRGWTSSVRKGRVSVGEVGGGQRRRF